MNIIAIVSITLALIWIILLIVAIATLGKIKFRWSVNIFFVCIICLAYWLIIRDRRLVIDEAFQPFDRMSCVYHLYIFTNHRYPLSMEDIRHDSVTGSLLDKAYFKKTMGYDPDYLPWLIRHWILKVPEYGTCCWLEDTIIHTALYLNGFDYDDDHLERKYNFHPMFGSRNTWEYAKYVLIPIPWDGDLLIEEFIRSIYDPWFDTTFVRQIQEQYGYTLSPDEYPRFP